METVMRCKVELVGGPLDGRVVAVNLDSGTIVQIPIPSAMVVFDDGVDYGPCDRAYRMATYEVHSTDRARYRGCV